MGKLRIVLAEFECIVSSPKMFGEVWGSKTTENFQVYIERIMQGCDNQATTFSFTKGESTLSYK